MQSAVHQTLATVQAAASPALAIDESKVTPGLLGFLVVFAIGMATWALLRSMTVHLGRVRVDREDAPEAGTPTGTVPASRPPRSG